MARTAKKLPKAQDVDLALTNAPQWLSGIKIPPALVRLFGISPGLIGALNLENLAETKALSEGALLQVEMANKFFEYLATICESHEEIENLRAEAIKLMYTTKTKEDGSVMSSLLAGAEYEEHYRTWQHQLTEEQGLIQGKGSLDRDYLSQDFKNRLLIAAEQTSKKKTQSGGRVERVREQVNSAAKEEVEEDQNLVAARARFDKLIKR